MTLYRIYYCCQPDIPEGLKELMWLLKYKSAVSRRCPLLDGLSVCPNGLNGQNDECRHEKPRIVNIPNHATNP